MSLVGPSVDGGYRRSRDNATSGGHFNHGGYWDPLVRGYGPVNVFNDEEIDTKIHKLDEEETLSQNNSGSRGSNNRNNSNNNRDNNNNNNEDRRNDDARHNNNQSNRNLSWQQRGSRWTQSTADRKMP